MISLHVEGENAAATAIACVLHRGGYRLSAHGPAFTVRTAVRDVPYITIDGIDCELERQIANEIGKLAPEGGVFLQIAGGIQDDTVIGITVPLEPKQAHLFAVAHGVLRAADRLLKQEKKRLRVPWWRRVFGTAAVLAIMAAPAAAQSPVTVRDATTGAVVPNIGDADGNAIRVLCVGGTCSGTGGTGGSLVTDNSTFSVGVSSISSGGVFNDGLSAVVSGKQATVRITASRAFHVNLRDASGVEIGTSGSPLFASLTNFPTTATTSALAVRCVNTAGNAFEACGGSGGGTTGQQTMANSAPVVIASNQSAVPVSGTFWQSTQPISGSVSVSNFPATQPVSLASVPSHAVTNAGTFAVQVTSAPTTAVTGTFWQATQPVSGTFWQATQPVSGTFWQATQPVSGSVTVSQGTGTNLHIVCDSGCSSSAGFADNGAFTFGTTAINPIAAVFDDTASNTATENSAAILRMTSAKGLHVNLRNAAGTELGTTADPVGINVARVGGNLIGGAQVPVSIDASTATVTTNLAGFNGGGTVGVGNGVSGTTVQRVTIASDSTGQVAVASFPDNEPFNVAQVGGVATATGQGVASTGTQRVTLAQEFTYAASTIAKTATAAGTGVFFEICGSASKTIRLQRFIVSGTVATAAVWGDVILSKRSAASTGGTSTGLTATPYDTGNATAGSATVKYYTVLGTGGALVGTLYSATQLFPVTAISATLQPTPAPLLWTWRDTDAEAPTLRGTAQCVTAHFGTTTTNAPTLNVSVAWTEK